MGGMIGGYGQIITAKLAPFSQYIRRKPVSPGNQTAERNVTIFVVIANPVLASYAGILKIGLIVGQYHPSCVLLPGGATGDGGPHAPAFVRRDITVLQQCCFVVIQSVDRTGGVQCVVV